MKKVFLSNLATKLGALAIKGKLSELANSINPDKFGGAPLLGVKGAWGYGSSNADAIKNGIHASSKVVREDAVRAYFRRCPDDIYRKPYRRAETEG